MSIEINKIKGVSLILGAGFMFSLMACMIKLASESINSFTTSFIRFLFGLCILSALMLTGRVRIKFNSRLLLIVRGVVGGTAVWITYLAIEKLGIVKGPLILHTYPVYASLFGVVILGEKLRLKNYFAIGLALVGIYFLVVKSGTVSLFSVGKYEIIAVIGALMAGFAVTIIRKLHATDSTIEIFFAQCLFGTMLMMVPATMSEQSINVYGILLLIGIAATAFIGQLFMTEGFRYLPVNIASVLIMSELILNCSFGVIVFDEIMDLRSVAGAGMILTACVLSLAGKAKGKANNLVTNSENALS